MTERTQQALDALYPHVARLVRDSAWALMPSKLAEIDELLTLRQEGQRLSQAEIEARVGGKQARRDLTMAGSVAVLPVYGVITGRADMFTEISGGTSSQRLGATFDEVLKDEDVSAIVLDIDSPGGSTDLLPELASQIREGRGTKPVVAVANTRAASAAYWLGSQADELYVTPSGDVGSIGVFAVHQDISEAMAKAGIKNTLISAGDYKTEGHPYEPLTEEAEESIQATINEFYDMFVDDVAAGRRVSVERVKAEYGQGRMLTAKQAAAVGMVDGIQTLEQVVQRHARGTVHVETPEPPSLGEGLGEAFGQGLTFSAEALALRDSAQRLVGRLASLAEVKRGDLTVTKREALQACPGELRTAAERIEEILAVHAEDDVPTEPGVPVLGLDAEADYSAVLARLTLKPKE